MLHELAHMLFDHHRLSEETDGPAMEALLPDLAPHLRERLLSRADFNTRQEQEAEMLASLIRTSTEDPHDPPPRGTLDKLGSALGVPTSSHDG